MKLKNVFYHHTLLKIGGIETFLYYMAKIYSGKYDITVIYKNADPNQIERLSKYVRCEKWNGEKIECEKFFGTYDTSIYEHVEAGYIAQVIHANFKHLKLKPYTSPKIDEYIAVSESVAAAYEELCGIKCTVIYNPIQINDPKKVLRLISATRLTKEKGKERMEKLADMLTKSGTPFQWLVFTNSPEKFKNPNIIKCEPRLELTDYIADADYLVQLSDTEGYCYSVNEALNLGTPVIVTDLETFREQGVKDGENGYLLDLDMTNVNIEAIAENVPKFKYIPRASEWNKKLEKSKSDYTKKINEKILVEATEEYQHLKVKDSELGKIPAPGERFYVNGIRLEKLLGTNSYNSVFVKEIKSEN